MWGWNHTHHTLFLNECPVSYITRESEWWVALHGAAQILKVPPVTDGLLEWPARLVDAFLLLNTEAYAEAASNLEKSPH